MNEPMPPDLPRSRRRRTIWPNLVWAVPLAALMIVAYLGIQALSHRGEVVTVTFARAAGARAGETKVIYQGVEAGQLIKIVPNKDGRSLDFKLRLMPEAKAGLNTNARFWLIGATPNLTDLSSLKAVVSGVAIGYAPGEGGEPTEHFEGLQRAPIILPSDRGQRFHLTARKLNSIREGSVVLFHGQDIGRVTELKFDGKDAFRLEIFVFEPFNSLITRQARFWKVSPLRLNFNDGITANLAPFSALLGGGIDVGLDSGAGAVEKVDTQFAFTLYESHGAARQGLSGPTERYEFAFSGGGGTLQPDDAVTLLGFQIGEVRSVHLEYDERTGEPRAIATADIYPERLRVAGTPATPEDWRQGTDAELRRLARQGYRAQLTQTPALFGDESIALVKVKAGTADLKDGAQYPRFPSAAGASFDDLSSQASQLLGNLNGIPFEAIGGNLRGITTRLKDVLDSPQLQQSLGHLHSTLANLDRILADAQPQVGPLLENLKDAATQLSGTAREAHQLLQNQGDGPDANLHEAVEQLTQAARSVQSLADYLSRHPESLIRGKRPTP